MVGTHVCVTVDLDPPSHHQGSPLGELTTQHGNDMPLHLLVGGVDEEAQDRVHSVSITMMPADSLCTHCLLFKQSLRNAVLSRYNGREGCSYGDEATPLNAIPSEQVPSVSTDMMLPQLQSHRWDW